MSSGRRLSNDHSPNLSPPKKVPSGKKYHRRNSCKTNTIKKEKLPELVQQLEDEEGKEVDLTSVLKIYSDVPTQPISYDINLQASLKLIELSVATKPSIKEKHLTFPACCFHDDARDESKDFGPKFQTIQAVGLGIKLKDLMN